MNKGINPQLNCCPFCGNIDLKVLTCTTMTGPDGVTPVEVQPYQRVECSECGMAVLLPAPKSVTSRQVACATYVACEVYDPASAAPEKDVRVDDDCGCEGEDQRLIKEANTKTKFEVGKSYYCTIDYIVYTVTKRTERFVTFKYGRKIIRRKPYSHAEGYEWVSLPYNHTIEAKNKV